MTRIIICAVAACCLASTLATAAVAATELPNALSQADRTIRGGRAVQVILAERQIETSVDIGRVASSANGGGILGAIIISSMDDKRKVLTQAARDQAEATAAPLRTALQGFDVDALALSTTNAAVAKPAWFQPRGVELNSASLNPVPKNSPQVAVISYRYETSPDFTQIRVIAEIWMERARAANGGAPALDPFYHQQVSSIVVLRTPSFEGAENVARWSADNGRLAKAALTQAFARLEQLIPFALDLKETDVKAITARSRAKVFAAGFYGPAVERAGTEASERLIWKDGLISVSQSGD